MPMVSQEHTLPWPDVPPDMGPPAGFLLLTVFLALAPSLLPLGDQAASPKGERSSTSAPDCPLCLAMESGDLQLPSTTTVRPRLQVVYTAGSQQLPSLCNMPDDYQVADLGLLGGFELALSCTLRCFGAAAASFADPAPALLGLPLCTSFICVCLALSFPSALSLPPSLPPAAAAAAITSDQPAASASAAAAFTAARPAVFGGAVAAGALTADAALALLLACFRGTKAPSLICSCFLIFSSCGGESIQASLSSESESDPSTTALPPCSISS
jgi:hypothetical protein